MTNPIKTDRAAYVALCRWHLHMVTVYTRRHIRTDLETMRRRYADLATSNIHAARWSGVTDAEYATLCIAETDSIRAEMRRGIARPVAEIAAGFTNATAYFRAAYPERFAVG